MAKKVIKKMQDGGPVPKKRLEDIKPAPIYVPKEKSTIEKKYNFSESDQKFAEPARKPVKRFTDSDSKVIIKSKEQNSNSHELIHERPPHGSIYKKGGSVKKKKK